jgi:hypothetical protein
MKRDYTSSDNVTGVTYFTGVEIEHTPAYGKDTLFVVGMQDPEEVTEIAKKEKRTTYISRSKSKF